MKKLYTLSFVLLATAISFGQSFTASYDFGGVTATTGSVDPTPVPTVPGLTLGSFTAVNPTASLPYNSTASGRFSFTSMPLGSTNGSDTGFIGVIDPAVYLQVVVNPNVGTTYSLSGITFGVRRSGTGIRNFAVRCSADNYAANLPASIFPANANLAVQTVNTFFWTSDATSTTADQVGSTVTLGTVFTNITTPVTFRFYGWNAEAGGGSFSLDNVALTGNVNALSTQSNSISGLSIYPNPATKGQFFITSNSGLQKSVSVFDVLGKQVLKANITDAAINVANLKSGVYFVKVIEDGKTATRKLVINN